MRNRKLQTFPPYPEIPTGQQYADQVPCEILRNQFGSCSTGESGRMKQEKISWDSLATVPFPAQCGTSRTADSPVTGQRNCRSLSPAFWFFRGRPACPKNWFLSCALDQQWDPAYSRCLGSTENKGELGSLWQLQSICSTEDRHQREEEIKGSEKRNWQIPLIYMHTREVVSPLQKKLERCSETLAGLTGKCLFLYEAGP